MPSNVNDVSAIFVATTHFLNYFSDSNIHPTAIFNLLRDSAGKATHDRTAEEKECPDNLVRGNKFIDFNNDDNEKS